MKAAPTDSASYIDQMIATEKENQKSGYLKRIEELEKERKSAILLDKVINGGDVEGYKKLSSMKLNDRAQNVKTTNRDKSYNGYNKTAPKNLQHAKDYTEVSSMFKQEDVDKLEALVKNLSSSSEINSNGTRFDCEKINLLLDKIQSMTIYEEEIESCETYMNNKKQYYEDSHNTNTFVKITDNKELLPKLSPRKNIKHSVEKDTVNDSVSDNKMEKDGKEYLSVTTQSDVLGRSSQSDEVNGESSTKLTTLQKINDGDDFNSILEYLQKKLQKNWAVEDINFLETIDLSELNKEERNLYLKSLRKA